MLYNNNIPEEFNKVDLYPFKGSSTKDGNNPIKISKRRKKNKNKKTHRNN